MASPIDLCTYDDVLNTLQTPDASVPATNYPELIPEYITEASRAIMGHTRREFRTEIGTLQANGLYDGIGTRRFKVNGYRIDFGAWDLQANHADNSYTVALHPETTEPMILTSYASTGYTFQPVNPQHGVYTALQFSGYLVIVSQTLMAYNYALVDITGPWGWPSVPEDVNRACRLTVASWLTRTAPGASQYGIPPGLATGAMPRGSDWDIPWAAKKLLGRYTRGSKRWLY